jgi:hypothetical protein
MKTWMPGIKPGMTVEGQGSFVMAGLFLAPGITAKRLAPE